MSDRMKNILKFVGVGVVWVYILSIRVGGSTLFQHANDILVQNQIVEAIDRQLAEVFESAMNMAGNAFEKISGRGKSI
jgi:hypothetical protein